MTEIEHLLKTTLTELKEIVKAGTVVRERQPAGRQLAPPPTRSVRTAGERSEPVRAVAPGPTLTCRRT